MNPFAASYNPMNAFAQGYAIGDSMIETAERQRQHQRALKARQALADAGKSPDLFGFEGVEGAQRPAWLAELYASDPESALQIEQRVSAPFEINRAAKKAGEIEEAKLKAKVAAWKPFMEDEGGGSPSMPTTGQPLNAFATGGVPLSVGVGTDEGITAPGRPMIAPAGVGSYQNLLTGDSLGTANRTKRTRKFSLEHGPSVEYEQIPEFEAEKARIEAGQKGRDLELKSQKTADELNNSRLAERERAHARVFQLAQQISALQKDKDAGTRNPRELQQELTALRQEKKEAEAYRDSLLKGRGAVEASSVGLTDEEKALAAQARAARKQGASGSASGAAPQVGAGLPYSKQVETQQKKLEGDINQTRKIIDTAHAAATSALQNKPATDRIMELLQKNDVGSRLLKLPGGETAATMFSGTYDELNKWRQSLILQEKEEGESQLYNTIPELKIHSTSLPAVDNDENTNRRAIVPVKNLLEARLLAPKFLEDWAHQHGGSLDGARNMFRSWMQHNPQYQTVETNGQVGIVKNLKYIPLDTWVRLRQKYQEKDLAAKLKNGNIEVIDGRVFENK